MEEEAEENIESSCKSIKGKKPMYYAVFRIIRKYPFVYVPLRNFHAKIRTTPFYYIKTLISDPHHLRASQPWYRQIKRTQIRENIPLFLDRQLEVQEFFGLNALDLFKYYLDSGCPNSRRFEEKLSSFFYGKTKLDFELKKAYEKSSMHYALRLMLAYERFSMIIPYVDYLLEQNKSSMKNWRVLDYGCGVSDIGILFAALGARVTIADLDDRKLEFARWRYKKRGLPVKKISIPDPSRYPNLPIEEFNLILATEVFEHVRDPLHLLTIFTKSLKKEGFLFDSMGGAFERDLETKGDHLPEAIEIGQSKAYRVFYGKNYIQCLIKEGLTCLFKKIS